MKDKAGNKKPATRTVLSSAPPPSSWRSILSLRGGGGDDGNSSTRATLNGNSKSSRIAAYRRQSSADDAYYDLDDAHGSGGGGVTTRGLFPGPSSSAVLSTLSPSRRPGPTNTTSTTSSSNNNNSHNKTPFLTLVLLKLDGLLDEYCLLLSHPSYQNAVRASVLMETCIATATTTTSSPHNILHLHQHHISPTSSRMESALSSLLTRSPTNHDHHPRGNMITSPTASPSNHSTSSAPSFRHWLQLSASSDHHHHHGTNQRNASSLSRQGGLRLLQAQQQAAAPSTACSPSFLSQSAMALQGEWETYQRPFLLLAAALVLYHGLQHVHNNKNANSNDGSATTFADSLQGLFQYLVTEFQTMEQTLCGPFLDMIMTNQTSTSTATNTNANSEKYKLAATHVAHALRTFSALCNARCYLIPIQCNAFHEMPSSFRDLEDSKAELAVVSAMTIQALQGINDNLAVTATASSDDDGGATDRDKSITKSSSCPLGEALLQELDTWKHCFHAAAALEACQFFDSIVSLAQFKQSLTSSTSPQDSSSPPTRLDEWFQKTHRHLTSLLPIYFDRVQAFAGPLYGFETQARKTAINNAGTTTTAAATTTTTTTPMASPPPAASSSSAKNSSGNIEEDWNAMVGELLRRQDRLGGPPTAVALVLDAMGTNNLHVERGFQLSASKNNAPQPPPRVGGGASGLNSNGISVEEQQQAAPSDNKLSSHVLWPAIYLRSTTHLKNSTHVVNSASFSSSRASLVSSNSVRGPGGFLLAAGGFEWSSSSQDIANQNSPSNTVRKATLTASTANWASNSSFTRTSNTANHTLSSRASHSNLSALEYEPDAGKASSWPHTEWDSLVNTLLITRHHHYHEIVSDDNDNLDDLREPPVLRPRVFVDCAAAPAGGDGMLASTTESVIATDGSRRRAALPRMMQEPIAVTYREDDDDQVPHHQQQHDQSSSATSLLSDGPAGFFRAPSALSSSDQLSLLPVVSFTGNNDDNKIKRHDTSTFHVVSLSRYISLVVIVKGDNVEESRFLRRRSRVTDEDIRAFLDHWAQKLRVSNRFTRSCLAKKARKEISLLEFSNPPQVTTATGSTLPTTPATWTATHVHTYFKQVKEAFGLRPTSSIHGSASRARSFGRSRSTSNRSPFGSKHFASLFLSSPRTLSDLRAATAELNGNIQKSIDLLFLGPDLAQVIEMYD